MSTTYRRSPRAGKEPLRGTPSIFRTRWPRTSSNAAALCSQRCTRTSPPPCPRRSWRRTRTFMRTTSSARLSSWAAPRGRTSEPSPSRRRTNSSPTPEKGESTSRSLDSPSPSPTTSCTALRRQGSAARSRTLCATRGPRPCPPRKNSSRRCSARPKRRSRKRTSTWNSANTARPTPFNSEGTAPSRCSSKSAPWQGTASRSLRCNNGSKISHRARSRWYRRLKKPSAQALASRKPSSSRSRRTTQPRLTTALSSSTAKNTSDRRTFRRNFSRPTETMLLSTNRSDAVS